MLKDRNVSSRGTQPHSTSYRLHKGRLEQSMGPGCQEGSFTSLWPLMRRGDGRNTCPLTQDGGPEMLDSGPNPLSVMGFPVLPKPSS